MFSGYCSDIESRILLGSRTILGLRNTDHGPEVAYECLCGAQGLYRPRHEASGRHARQRLRWVA